MAFKKRGGHSRPQYSISTSIFVRKGKYIKGPSFGLWDADSGPMARGSVKEDYLSELREFLAKAEKRDMSVSFALFKNKKRKDEDEEEEDEEEDEEDDEDDEDEDAEEEEEKKSAAKTGKKKPADRGSTRGKKDKAGKKSDWDFDDED